MRIILIGSQGVGKTSVGFLLHKKLGVPFFNIDNYLHDILNFPIKETYTSEEYVEKKKQENLIVEQIIRRKTAYIISAGAGFSSDDFKLQDGLSTLQSISTVIYLEKTPEEVLERYDMCAHYCFYTKNKPFDEVVNEIVETIGFK